MSESQKNIRRFAIFLAIFLIAIIVTSIFYFISSAIAIFKDSEDQTFESNKNLIIQDSYDIEKLEIKLNYTKLFIKNGTELTAQTNNKDIEITSKNHKLVIEETNHNFLKNYKDYVLTIYIPEDTIFDDVEIEAGAGKIQIETLKSYDLDLDLGAGAIEIYNLYVFGNTKIEGGTGSTLIKNGSLNNLNLDIDVGKVTLNSSLAGVSKIEGGIGEFDLKIFGQLSDYTITTRKGLGSINLNGSQLETKTTYGTGANILDINGGIGKINLVISENNNN